MGDCACGGGNGAGPFATGQQLVEFVYRAHGGGLRGQALPGGGLETACQGCGAAFRLRTFVGACPACGGVHAISPPRVSDPQAIQFAGKDFTLAGL
jgi:hypothetical protein